MWPRWRLNLSWWLLPSHLLSNTLSRSNCETSKCVLLIFSTALLDPDHIWSRHLRGHVVPSSLFTWTNRYAKNISSLTTLLCILIFPQQFARALSLAYWGTLMELFFAKSLIAKNLWRHWVLAVLSPLYCWPTTSVFTLDLLVIGNQN